MSHGTRHIPQVPVSPILPQPRGEFVDASYMTQLVRALEITLTNLTEIGALRGGTLFLARLPKNGNQLRAGEVYDDGGFLKIAQENIGYGPSLFGEAELGSVTVTTS
jgi:hypothetical protein